MSQNRNNNRRLLRRYRVDPESTRLVAAARAALDGDVCTLHVRCGSGIEPALREAGLRGDFYEHSFPYLIAPVREGAGSLSNSSWR